MLIGHLWDKERVADFIFPGIQVCLEVLTAWLSHILGALVAKETGYPVWCLDFHSV